ncbi:hypothetical protein HYX70_04320 [Candidatus Saccharibacteria bacterium]|nr:hypothetical protein [Candidatus Saccharibacteria bacterium]
MDHNNQTPQRPSGLPSSMQPNRARPATHSQPQTHQVHNPRPPVNRNRRFGFWILITVLLVLVVGIGLLIFRIATGNYNELAVKKDKYQAVFLNNSMVYFGKMSNVDGSYVKLTNVYYLQFQNQNQPSNQSNNQSQQISLAKLGGELHGPEDVMYIDRRSIMFWENLQDSGRVVQTIKEIQSKSGSK